MKKDDNQSNSSLSTTPFIPNEKFINMTNKDKINIAEKIIETNKSVPYYPLPSNDGYEKFLQSMKKDQCNE